MNDVEQAAVQSYYQTMVDETASSVDREHAYWMYWQIIIDTSRSLKDEQVRTMTCDVQEGWTSAMGNLIKMMCERDMLTDSQVETLLSELDHRLFSWQQIEVLKQVRAKDLPWTVALETAAKYKSEWACWRILREHSTPEDLATAELVFNNFPHFSRGPKILQTFRKQLI